MMAAGQVPSETSIAAMQQPFYKLTKTIATTMAADI